MSDEDSDCFCYSQLRDEIQEIRLMRILGIKDGKIDCQIRTFALEEAPKYTALSYLWGDSLKPHSIIADGKTLHITTNLKLFLDEVASRQHEPSARLGWPLQPHQWFWIDAICIHQEDAVERSHQVGHMKDIYETADMVVAWLGRQIQYCEKAMGFLEDVYHLDGSWFLEGLYLADGVEAGNTFRYGTARGHIEFSCDTLAALVELQDLEYWKRVWIVQEVSPPKEFGKTMVCCGQFSISWHIYGEAYYRLASAALCFGSKQDIRFSYFRNPQVAAVRFVTEQRRKGFLENDFYSVLCICVPTKATDPRDKVYGLLGLAGNTQINLIADYTLSIEETYTRFAKIMIQASNSLELLGSAGLARSVGVRSWVPTWAHHLRPPPFFTDTGLGDNGEPSRVNPFAASSGISPEVFFNETDDLLRTRGVCFDNIKTVSLAHPGAMVSLSELTELWEDWISLVGPDDEVYPGGGTRFNAFLKTLTLNDHPSPGGFRLPPIPKSVESKTNILHLDHPVINDATSNRRLLLSSRGYVGLAPAAMQPGDVIAILFGSQMPMILRKVNMHWLFIGEAYVHGIMYGEALDQLDLTKDVETFTIA
jgi:hypothetical protein